MKRVDQLCRAEDNTLAAWVNGSECYATSARVGEVGDFEYFCTCPYNWGPCKHTVAVILAAAQQVKNKASIPLLDENDDLYEALYGYSKENDEWLDEEWEDDDSIDTTAPLHTKTQTKIRKLLDAKNQDELLNLLIDLIGRFPDVREHIIENEQLVSGQVDKLVRMLKTEIRDLTAEPAWYNHWRGEGNLPDYTQIEEKLNTLANQGDADAVLQLGEELWNRGNDQVEQSDDEGETAMAIASGMEIVLAALPQSSLSLSEQLLWVIDKVLADEYSLLESAEKLLKRRFCTSSHWRSARLLRPTLEYRLPGTSQSDREG